MTDHHTLSGNVALITGAAHRIGATLARALHAEGADVVIHYRSSHAAAEQLVHYLATAIAALSVLPTLQQIVFERFFDETGDMHFVVHSCYGSRINRAWVSTPRMIPPRNSFSLSTVTADPTGTTSRASKARTISRFLPRAKI